MLTQKLVGGKARSAERTYSRFGWDSEVSTKVNAQVVLVLVRARAQVTLERARTCVNWQMLVILGLEKKSLIAEVAAVDLLFQ